MLADSNILLRMVDTLHPDHAVTRKAVDGLVAAGSPPIIVPQNLYEFWVAATRPPSTNGLGLTTAAAKIWIDHFKQVFRFLPDPSDLHDRWEALVVAHQCKGKPAHDARIVAAMDAHGITSILTFNGKDFTRYPHLTVLDPAAVVP